MQRSVEVAGVLVAGSVCEMGQQQWENVTVWLDRSGLLRDDEAPRPAFEPENTFARVNCLTRVSRRKYDLVADDSEGWLGYIGECG